MANTDDTGNPNVFTIFTGKFDITLSDNCYMDKPVIMMTAMNIGEFVSNAELTAYVDGETFATLDAECSPSTPIKIPVFFNDSIAPLIINPDGTMSITGVDGDGTLHLNGASFNISDRWY